MKVKITLKDWTYIGRYNYAAKWIRPFCVYTLTKEDEQSFIRAQEVHILAYVLMFIPLHILQALVLMWDGGLKEFEIFKRKLGHDILRIGSPAYEKAQEVFNNQFINNKNE
jgi:hypothetical protein